MNLCLVRHAIAVERGTAGYTDDRARPLTPEGRKRMREAAAGLKAVVSIGSILSSPLLRARQTAEILQDVFKADIRTIDALGAGDHRATLAECGKEQSQTVALVGHEPWMSELLSYLLAGDAHTVASVFRKGAAALVAFAGEPSAGGGTLEWLVQPGALRRVGR